jgi:hypothetical protein
MSEKQQTLTLTTEDLQKLISSAVNSAVTTAVTEMRKPEPPSEKELAALKQQQDERLQAAEGVKQKNENRRFIQEKVCTHAHALREGGGTHATYVHDNDVPLSPGYIYCQKCEGRIRPDEPIMRKLDPQAIFDSNLFNRLMQDCVHPAAEILSQ